MMDIRTLVTACNKAVLAAIRSNSGSVLACSDRFTYQVRMATDERVEAMAAMNWLLFVPRTLPARRTLGAKCPIELTYRNLLAHEDAGEHVELADVEWGGSFELMAGMDSRLLGTVMCRNFHSENEAASWAMLTASVGSLATRVGLC